jgi:hypothetical protein
VVYREEVHHPALPLPEVASGVLWVTADGHLLRDQHSPQREISEIGGTFISVRATPEGPVNLLLIPAELRPMLDAIRFVVAGDARATADDFVLNLLTGASGWRVEMIPKDHEAPEMQIVLVGCGTVLQAIEIEQAHGVRRIITIEHRP